MSYVHTPSGLIMPESIAEERYARRAPQAVEFFAGAGGMACGLKQAGWDVVAAVEWDCLAVMTYACNLCRYGDLKMHFVEDGDRERMEKALWDSYRKSGEKSFPTAGGGWIESQPGMTGTKHIFVGDVRKLTGQCILDTIGMKRGELDAVTGGPPCQGFSKAGKQNVMDPRNSLVFEFARLIIEMHPKTIVMENVPAILEMVTPDGVPVVDAFCRILEDGGFGAIDALKRSIGQQNPSALGLLRSSKKSKHGKGKSHVDDGDIAAPAQSDLFAAGAVA